MIFTGLLVAFLFSSCWATDEGSSGDEIPFGTASQGNSDEEIPFVVASQGNTQEEIPFVVASQENSGDLKASNLLPDVAAPNVPPLTTLDNRGRSDIEIQDDQRSGGYFYPKPEKPFNLPQFTTLDATAPLNAVANFAEENASFERSPRSTRRRPPYFQSPPPFIPGFIPPHNVRPLPALYGRPAGY